MANRKEESYSMAYDQFSLPQFLHDHACTAFFEVFFLCNNEETKDRSTCIVGNGPESSLANIQNLVLLMWPVRSGKLYLMHIFVGMHICMDRCMLSSVSCVVLNATMHALCSHADMKGSKDIWMVVKVQVCTCTYIASLEKIIYVRLYVTCTTTASKL